jgi:hypothetical protein
MVISATSTVCADAKAKGVLHRASLDMEKLHHIYRHVMQWNGGNRGADQLTEKAFVQ